MKKFFFTFSIFALFIVSSFGQYDLQVTLNSPASGSPATGVSGFEIAYTISNNGPDEIPAGDTLYLALLYSGNNYSLINGEAGSVSLVVLPAAIPAGASLVSSTLGINAIANLSGVSGDVCMFVTVGLAGFTTIDGDPNDSDMENNLDCFTSVPASASIESNTPVSAVAYPNPTSDVLNITVEGDEVVSVAVIAMDGKVVSNNQGSTALVADLTAGMYIYEARTASGAIIRNTFMKK
jgi:hypothetical protein